MFKFLDYKSKDLSDPQASVYTQYLIILVFGVLNLTKYNSISLRKHGPQPPEGAGVAAQRFTWVTRWPIYLD